MNLAHRVNLFKVTRSENLEDQIFRTEIYNFVINLNYQYLNFLKCRGIKFITGYEFGTPR